MPSVTKDAVINKAVSLLESGTVDRVVGYARGEFIYDETPHVFKTKEDIEENMVFDIFSCQNFSKFLIKESAKDGKAAVFMKPCDTFSFVQLMTEHRVKRENVYIIGVDCGDMADIHLLREKLGDDNAILAFEDEGNTVSFDTLYAGKVKIAKSEITEERCLSCKSHRHVIYDELLCSEGEDFGDEKRFAGVEKLEQMTEAERYGFWQKELSKCIRCNACRNACPACSCENCVFDNPDSGIQNKAAVNSFEENLFHIIRAYHVAGRCTDCGECSRVCPQRIPLHLLNRKYIKDINELYGEYRAGAKEDQRAPMVNYTEGDPEPGEEGRA